MKLTQERLKKLLYYDPETGLFTWRTGSVAGGIGGHGYIQIGLNYKRYLAHRLAFLFMIGEIPEEVDHINGERTDNRWVNLRTCTTSQNQGNRKISKNNTSGYKGVSLNKRDSVWIACVEYKSKLIYLGGFNCKHEAALAYNKAAIKYFGEFAKLNIIRNNKDD